MVQIIPAAPSFKNQMARNLGEGIGRAGVGLFEALAERNQQKASSDYFKKLAEENPDDKSYQLLSKIYGSPLPSEQKANFAKNILGNVHDPYRQEQQRRLERDSLSRGYSQKIKEIDAMISNPSALNELSDEDRAQLKPMRQALIDERDSIMGIDGSRFMQEAPEEEEEDLFDVDEIMSTPKKKAAAKAKVKFDMTNPQHKARAAEILKKAQGDKRKASLVLAKEFE